MFKVLQNIEKRAIESFHFYPFFRNHMLRSREVSKDKWENRKTKNSKASSGWNLTT